MVVILLLFGSFIIFLLIGVPIYAAIGTPVFISILASESLSPTLIPQTFFNGIENYVLVAVGLFIVSGAIMQASGLADEILEVADSMIGHIPGGVGAAAILASAIFGALTGSGLAATVAIGSITIGGMVQRGYSRALAGAISASGGALGILIPPSNPMIIYGVLSGVSIGSLFMAGMIPGLLITFSLGVVMYFIGRKKQLVSKDKKFSWTRMFTALWNGKWALMAPVVILGSIYTGIATPTEAAEFAVFYALFYGFVIRRSVRVKELVSAFRNGAMLAAVMLCMTGVASGFGRLVTMYQVPQKLGEFVASFTDNSKIVLLMVVILLLFTGMFMETLSQIIIITPILLPVVTSLGVDPIVFGIIFILCIEIGFLTPPIGGNLFVAVKLTDEKLMAISKAEIPFILTFLAWAVIFIFFPEIIMFLPNLLNG